MIKLHGTLISNFHNCAKLALVEKGVPFEEVSVMPSRDPAVLRGSPMGKVPFIERDGLWLSEVHAIFDYLEDLRPEPPLYPSDPWERAKTKELIRSIELYLDAPARRLLPAVYFGRPVDPVAEKEVRPALELGLKSLEQLARFSPYIAGESFTFADIAAYFHLQFVNLHTTRVYQWDITEELPRLADYLKQLADRPSVREVDDPMQRALAKFLPEVAS